MRLRSSLGLVPLAQSQDRVESYLRGKPLGTVIEAGQLRPTDERGSSVIIVATGRLTYRDDQEIPNSSGLHPRSRG